MLRTVNTLLIERVLIFARFARCTNERRQRDWLPASTRRRREGMYIGTVEQSRGFTYSCLRAAVPARDLEIAWLANVGEKCSKLSLDL